MNTTDEQLGKRIARYRHNIGLTQEELAEAVHVQPETITEPHSVRLESVEQRNEILVSVIRFRPLAP